MDEKKEKLRQLSEISAQTQSENEELKKDIDSKYFILISSFSVSQFLLSGDADHDDGEDGIEDLSGDWCVRRDMKERKKPGKMIM